MNNIQGTSKYIAFIDECGDHSMEKIDKYFPLFVLSIVIIERKEYIEKIIPTINRFKLRYWDHEGVNLHNRDIRKANGAFKILQNSDIREEFMKEICEFMSEFPYTLFIIGIHKEKHMKQYKEAKNPYDLAIVFAFERILHFLETNNEIYLPVIVESRGKNEDKALESVFYKLLANGTKFISAERFKKLNCPLLFEKKKNNICGLQLADLCAYPSARYMLNPVQANIPYDVVKKHIYNTGVKGWKIFP